jgi:uncharacterized protein YndB with AHSA1/START domain
MFSPLLLCLFLFYIPKAAMGFQDKPGEIFWKLHFVSSPEKVYSALSKSEERKKYWADSAEEKNGVISYVFNNLNFTDVGKVIEAVPNKKYSVVYLSTEVTFTIKSDGKGGADMALLVKKVPADRKVELIAGWVNWLMTMKAAVDHGIDLRGAVKFLV